MLDALESLIHPLYWIVSAVLLGWHWLFSQVLPADSGWTWALAIIGLTATTRAALIPLFVKQIKSSRNMQMLQPKVKELQKKYGHDRERLAQETMALYKDAGTNPFASCLPILAQAPIFFALFRVISQAARNDTALGLLDADDVNSLDSAVLFAGVKIADTFLDANGNVAVQIVTLCLVALMTATTFTTQRQLMRKNMPASAMSGPYAQQQKMLLYVLPVVFAVGGIAFPIGVLLYWSTSNLWTMGQQFYVIRNNPAPGTPAFEAKQKRDIKHGKVPAQDADPVATAEDGDTKTEPARRQPKKTSRKTRQTKAPSKGQSKSPNKSPSKSPSKSPTKGQSKGTGQRPGQRPAKRPGQNPRKQPPRPT